MKKAAIAAVLIIAGLGLAGCSSADSPVGVWQAPDGTIATIGDDGSCSNMYWTQGQSLDIGGGMSCTFGDGTLVVNQPPNSVSYGYTLDGDTLTLDGSLVFTRQ